MFSDELCLLLHALGDGINESLDHAREIFLLNVLQKKTDVFQATCKQRKWVERREMVKISRISSR